MCDLATCCELFKVLCILVVPYSGKDLNIYPSLTMAQPTIFCSTLSGDKAMDDDEDYLLFTAIANWFIGGGAEGWPHETTKEGATSSATSPSSAATQRVILVLLLPLLLHCCCCCCLKRQLRTF